MSNLHRGMFKYDNESRAFVASKLNVKTQKTFSRGSNHREAQPEREALTQE